MSFNRSLGIALIVLVAAIWVTSSFIVKDLESNAEASPYIITFFANALFVLLLPIAYLRRWIFPNKEKTHPLQRDAEIFRTAAIVAPFLWLGQLTFNASLELTSVSSNTVLSSTGSLFTFTLSLIFLNERFHLYKVVSLIVCFTGTLLVALSDRDVDSGNENPLMGDLLTVLSAMIYACYTIMMSKWIPDAAHADMLLFFGFVGIVQFFVFSFIGAILLAAGLIHLDLSLGATFLIFAKGFFDNVLSDILWIRSVFLIGPTVATVGLSLQWPIAIAIDALFFSPAWMQSSMHILLAFLGSLLVLIGFVGINLPSYMFSNTAGHLKFHPIYDDPKSPKALNNVVVVLDKV